MESVKECLVVGDMKQWKALGQQVLFLICLMEVARGDGKLSGRDMCIFEPDLDARNNGLMG